MNEIDQLVIDLEVVGQVRSSDKLGVHCLPGETRLVVDSGSYSQSFRRWYNNCNRDDSMKYLNALVQRCQTTAAMIVGGRLRGMATSLRASATRAISGLQNLQSTYSSDSTTVAHLSLIHI